MWRSVPLHFFASGLVKRRPFGAGDGKLSKEDFDGRGQGVATARTLSEGVAQAKSGNKKAQQAGAGRAT